MANSRDLHSIEHEPHLQGREFGVDASESLAADRLAREHNRKTEHDDVDHNVWEEPGLAAELAGSPDESQLTYERWLDKNIAATSWPQSWLIVLGIAIVAGPWAILGAFMSASGGVGLQGLMLVAVIAPVTEEIAKIAAALWVVEKRPFWFKSLWQLLLCGAAGGAVFAAIENLIYLNVYIPNPSRDLVLWRTGVCTALHVTCSLIAGLGLVRIWDHTMRHRTRPQIALGVPWFVQAMIGHGVYNASVTIAEATGWLDLG